MVSDKFCKHCGAQLDADSEFCQKCGKPVKPLPVTTPAATAISSRISGKIGGIDKRLLIAIGVIILILVVPVIPRDKVIYVSGQTTTNQTYQSTSLQTIMTTTQTSIQVYVGTLLYVSNQYYSFYTPYYSGCVRGYYGIIRCGYTSWPYWNTYTTAVTVNPSDNFVSMQNTQEVGGPLSTVTLTRYDGTSAIYTHVIDNSLTQSGTSTVQASATQTNTITQTLSTVVNVPCSNCIPQHVTEYVNIIQYLTQR
jgi:cell division protein FtsL